VEVRECEVAIDPNRTGVTREGACVPTGENFLFLSRVRGGDTRTLSDPGPGVRRVWSAGRVSEVEPREASTRLHYATAWPANDELVLVLIIVIVIESQEKGQKFATLKRYIENR
jgi:hypothetical protein